MSICAASPELVHNTKVLLSFEVRRRKFDGYDKVLLTLTVAAMPMFLKVLVKVLRDMDTLSVLFSRFPPPHLDILVACMYHFAR
jgi:hypothetical protein